MAKYHKTGSHSRRMHKHVYSLAEKLAREEIQQKIQDALKAERDEIVGRGRYERLASSQPEADKPFAHVYRNGYHKPRCLICGCGGIEVRVPQLEVPYESQIVPRYERLTAEMKALLPELYLHGLSTGDFDPVYGGWL